MPDRAPVLRFSPDGGRLILKLPPPPRSTLAAALEQDEAHDEMQGEGEVRAIIDERGSRRALDPCTVS